MAIRKRGGKDEYVFTAFHGKGVVDALNMKTGRTEKNVALLDFTADGGTGEIIREVQRITDWNGRK